MDLRTYSELSSRLVRKGLRASKNGLPPGQLADAQFENVVEVDGPRREGKSRGGDAPAVGAEGGTPPNIVVLIPMVAASHAAAKRHPAASAAIIDLSTYRERVGHASARGMEMDRACRGLD